LHLILGPERAHAREVIGEQARDPGVTVSVVLGEGLSWPDPPPVRLLRLATIPGAPAQPAPPPGTVDYAHLLRLIFEADTVVTW
jgi:hypothetical protein